MESHRHFKISKISSINLLDIEQIRDLVVNYKAESFDDEVFEYQIIQKIQDSLPFGVWFIYEGEKILGFLVCSILNDSYNNAKCFVDYLFASNEIRTSEIIKEFCQVGIDWAKSQNVNKIVFVTRRDPDAMCKFLPGNWVKDSSVLSLCV